MAVVRNLKMRGKILTQYTILIRCVNTELKKFGAFFKIIFVKCQLTIPFPCLVFLEAVRHVKFCTEIDLKKNYCTEYLARYTRL
jgi:hypothetical protein